MIFLKRYKYTLIAILLFILDFGLTWYFIRYGSADLEGNPLFHIDGGFIALILNFIYIITILLLESLVIRKYETIVVEANNGYNYFKNILKSEKWNFMIVSLIFSFIISTFASRLTAIIDWIIYGIYRGNYHKTTYAIIRDKMPLNRYDIIVVPLAFILSFIIWYKIEYKKSKELRQ